mgnify:CR=1 FL=1
MAKNLLINGEIFLYGPVGIPWGDGFTPSDVAQALAEHGDGDVTVRINSGGGIAFDGSAIYALFSKHPGKVTMVVDGVAASAASAILMAGEKRILSRGAGIMIHDPSTITLGNADEHKKTAKFLDQLSNEYAALYASATEQDEKKIRSMMKDETWLFGDEAVEKGFAHEIAQKGEAAVEPSAFAYDLYKHAPAHLPRCEMSFSEPAASAVTLEKVTMTVKNPDAGKSAGNDDASAAAAAAAAVKETGASAGSETSGAPAVKAWAGSFYASAGASNLPIADLNEIVANAASLDAAKDALIEKMAEDGNKNKPAPIGARASVGTEAHEKFVEGATKAIIGKVAMFNVDGKMSADGERNEFTSLSLRELARASLAARGIRIPHDPMEMVGMSFAPVMAGGMLTSSDFANVLANVGNKSMLKGYEEAEETFQKWTGKGTLSDFKTVTRVDTGLFPSLAEVPEGAEYSYAKISDRKETMALATYGKLFGITRQAIINDDLSAFTRIPAKMGRAAKRTIGNLVYAILIDNPTMSDTVALFHANHGNLATSGSAMAVATLDAGRSAMAKQKDPDAHATALNIRPRWNICPVALEGLAWQLYNSATEPGQSNPNLANRVAKMAEPVADARLDAASATAWYLAADANQHETIEVAYLNGKEAPTLERREGWSVDQLEFKVRLDAGVKAWEWRTLRKATGAA